jgi:hypothetical protein
MIGTDTSFAAPFSEAAGPMTPQQQDTALGVLHDAVIKIDATLNDGLKLMVAEHRIELKQIRADVETIRSTVVSHVAKEDVIYEIFKRVMNTGVTITGALIALLLSVIGYLLVHPVGLH